MFAHEVGGGALPAPPWLLAYLGVAAVLGTAVALRATWPRSRGVTRRVEGTEAPAAPRLGIGHLIGLVLFGGALAAAIVGPDTAAANIAPVAVLVVWWVGLPLVCLLLGDVQRWINPLLPVAAGLRRLRGEPATAPEGQPADPLDVHSGDDAPRWTAAAFVAAFAWYFLAFHRPGSPRALALFLVAYALVAIALGARWGTTWLATGEGFGGLSDAVSRIGLRRPRRAVTAGILPLGVVWLGSSAFDAATTTSFWVNVLGTSHDWPRTLLNTVGLVWITAIVAGVVLLVVRVLQRADPDAAYDERHPATTLVGVALVPIAAAWFIAHDLTLLLFEGQNFFALLSDPIGRGWDLFGTLDHSLDMDLVQATWVRWVQIVVLLAGHVAAVVLLHDGALERLHAGAAMRATWTMAAVTSGSAVAAALLVLP